MRNQIFLNRRHIFINQFNSLIKFYQQNAITKLNYRKIFYYFKFSTIDSFKKNLISNNFEN